ncbi:MAG: sodium/proline symporter [Candidatus Eisenbacteria bacterium]|nr:sodium/proline symporter [Candidatus Eisenbacteria bacterium]
MSNAVVYSIVLGLYVAVLIAVGLWMGRRTRSAEDFYIGGRQVGPWVTAFSFVAAYFSSVVIVGGGAFGYSFGMSTLWIAATNVLIGCTLVWIVLGRRLWQFTKRLDAMTIPGFIGKRYGSREAEIFSAAIIFVFMIIYNVSVLVGMGRIMEGLMGIPYTTSVLIAGLIILIYVSVGGYLAVVWTSFVQAWIMIFGLLLLTFATLQAVGGLTQANIELAALNRGFVETPGVWGWGGLVSFALIVSLGVWGMPQLLVRFYSMKSTRVLRLGTVLATLGGAMAVLPYLTGAVSRLLLPPLANPDLAIPMLTEKVLNPWGGAIFLAGVMAAGMSTFSSVLIIVSGAIVRDLRRSRPVAADAGVAVRRAGNDVVLGRVASLVAGLLALAMAYRPPALVLVITAFAWAVIASACLWPVVLGVYWRRGTRAGALSSMVAGTVVALGWMAAGKPLGLHGFIPGVVVSLVVFVAVSLATTPPDQATVARAWGEE